MTVRATVRTTGPGTRARSGARAAYEPPQQTSSYIESRPASERAIPLKRRVGHGLKRPCVRHRAPQPVHQGAVHDPLAAGETDHS